MLATVFVSHVKAKLNRLDSQAYEDVRQEEIIFFANDALKTLTLEFDLGQYSQILNRPAILVYLGSLIDKQTALPLTSNEATLLASVLKFKDVEAYVTRGSEAGWVSASREMDNEKTSDREGNPFKRSYPDTPTYRLIGGKIKFDAQDFTCTQYRYDFLRYPTEITLATNILYTFIPELEDKTVTLILENLEAQRLKTQPLVSRS